MLIIYDKSKSSNDEFKRVLVMAKNGELRYKAQIALSEFAESTLETNDMINNKTNIYDIFGVN